MSDMIRDAPLGQIIRWVTRNRLLQYPEERPDFQCPSVYKNPDASKAESEKTFLRQSSTLPRTASRTASQPDSRDTFDVDHEVRHSGEEDLEKIETAKDLELEGQERRDIERIQTVKSEKDLEGMRPTKSTKTNATANSALSRVRSRKDLEQQLTQAGMPRQPSRPIVPEKLDDGTILVDWYDTDDPANPQSWSFRKKLFTLMMIW